MSPNVHKDEDLDAEIYRLESMSSDEIDATLAKQGIDVQQTIEAVTALVKEKCAEWRRRGKRVGPIPKDPN